MVGFWGKTQHFMHERLQLPGPHKEFTCFPTIPHQKLSNQCIFQALCSYILEILPFSLQKWFQGYFAKGIWRNFTYFPTKIIVSCIMFYQIIA